MKYLALVLAIYTTALTFVPCSDIHAGQFNLPSTIQQAQDHHEEDQDLCTPFCQCTCCQSFVLITNLGYSNSAPFLSVRPMTAYIDELHSSSAKDHWQPPRVG